MNRLLDALLLLRHGWRPRRSPYAGRWRVVWRDPRTGYCFHRVTARWLCDGWRRRKGLS